MNRQRKFSDWILGFSWCLVFLASVLVAQDNPVPVDPEIADASDDAQLAIDSFKLPDGTVAKLFAAEPFVANAVAIHVDVDGRVYVCETFRQELGVEDNREHPEWLLEDLAAQSVEDRIRYIKKHEPDIKKEYHDQDDRIRLLFDRDGDGQADDSKIFSSGYNAIEDGTGAGVLSVGDDVFYTNIPHLWRLRDKDDDGVADQRDSLHRGFGVRFAFRGHDLHGLIVGPDRRLYFSIGDRGYNISPDVFDPASGAVFRCELDGSDLQVFATGLRNPQELAFDDFGNLFTGDNNSDSGDEARWVYVLPGSDAGWRMYYQYLPDRGPFNREKIWQPYNEDTPAYIVPPIANISDGPSGLAFYPGTGLTDYFKGRFFLCDFRGATSVSGIRSFRLKQNGAGFEIVDSDQSVWNILATDVDFGPDGKMYISDWVHGWQGVGKGRVYTIQSTDDSGRESVEEVQDILSTGLKTKTPVELVTLLQHADRRIRYAAQFELEDRGELNSLFGTFFENTENNKLGSQFRKIHSLWGIANIFRKTPGLADRLHSKLREKLDAVVGMCAVGTPELKAQIAKFVGDQKLNQYREYLHQLAADNDLRVRMMAALAIGDVGSVESFNAIETLLDENADADPFLRHGGIMAFVGCLQDLDESRKAQTIERLRKHHSRAVRLAAVVALRKLNSNSLHRFLADSDPSVVLETARAIYDLPNTPGIRFLAKMIETPNNSDPFIRRVINAAYIIGDVASAKAIGEFATKASNNLERRKDAIRLLGSWDNPNPIDYVIGDWRPSKRRDSDAGASSLSEFMQFGLSDLSIAAEYIDACIAAKVAMPEARLKQLAVMADQPEIPSKALLALKTTSPRSYRDILKSALDKPQQFPLDWFDLLSGLEPDTAVTFLVDTIATSTEAARRRQAIQTLGKFDSHEMAGKQLVSLLEDIKSDTIEAEFHLDILMAAECSSQQNVTSQISKFYSQRGNGQRAFDFKFALQGGDAGSGRKVFFERGDLSCVRCHTIGSSGGNVGPNLSGIGLNKNRQYLLDSIVHPNKEIAEGYSERVLMLDDGQIVAGIVQQEDEASITLLDKDGISIRISTDSIDQQKTGQSSMPVDLIDKISLTDLRDLIEYLAKQKAKDSQPAESQGH